ncbi:hypothetical protein IKZ77_00965, partial [Candidatus Saccharibacteria bacterium]|nr:hypothetical protein [Candidatus Saccharibacteria bacterium]
VVEAHKMVLDLGVGVQVLGDGDDADDSLEVVQLGIDGFGSGEERGVEKSTTASSGDEVESVDDILETRIGMKFIAEKHVSNFEFRILKFELFKIYFLSS